MTPARLWRRVGRRGTCMLMFAFLDYMFAFSYFNPAPDIRRTAFVSFLAEVAPLWLWGACWLVVAVTCTVAAFMKSDRWGFAAASGIKVMWGLLYVIAAFSHVPRAWLGAVLWLAIAGWVGVVSTWPDPAKEGTVWTTRS